MLVIAGEKSNKTVASFSKTIAQYITRAEVLSTGLGGFRLCTDHGGPHTEPDDRKRDRLVGFQMRKIAETKTPHIASVRSGRSRDKKSRGGPTYKTERANRGSPTETSTDATVTAGSTVNPPRRCRKNRQLTREARPAD